jgi:hypothetical protein
MIPSPFRRLSVSSRRGCDPAASAVTWYNRGMSRRIGALAVAIVLAALPSLNRICLTGCDVEKVATPGTDRSGVAMAAQAEREGTKNCPLHDSQSTPEPTGTPDAPSSPAPCQHQQEVASPDYAKSRSLALGADDAFGTLAAVTVVGPLSTAIHAPLATIRPSFPRRPANALVLRI